MGFDCREIELSCCQFQYSTFLWEVSIYFDSFKNCKFFEIKCVFEETVVYVKTKKIVNMIFWEKYCEIYM